VNRKLPVGICLCCGGSIDVLRNGRAATGSAAGRFLNVTASWGAGDPHGRSDDTARGVGIDGRCQSEEEYGSGEGLEEHLNNEWMKVRRMAGGSAIDRLC
jgi:hypothetical protein